MINVKKTTAGASVSLPYPLRDDFRIALPSAKWNPERKTWELGSQDMRQLDGWLEKIEASGLLEELALFKEAELSARDLEQLQISFGRIELQIMSEQSHVRRSEEPKARAVALRVALEARRLELAAAIAAREVSEAARQRAREDIEAPTVPIVT